MVLGGGNSYADPERREMANRAAPILLQATLTPSVITAAVAGAPGCEVKELFMRHRTSV